MRLDSTARSRSRSMSKAPRDTMGVKDITVSLSPELNIIRV